MNKEMWCELFVMYQIVYSLGYTKLWSTQDNHASPYYPNLNSTFVLLSKTYINTKNSLSSHVVSEAGPSETKQSASSRIPLIIQISRNRRKLKTVIVKRKYVTDFQISYKIWILC